MTLTKEQAQTWRYMTAPVGFPNTQSELVDFVGEVCKMYMGEINDSTTRNQINNDISQPMVWMEKKKLLFDHQIICDQSNNPPSVIDEGKLVVDIHLKYNASVAFTTINVIIGGK